MQRPAGARAIRVVVVDDSVVVRGFLSRWIAEADGIELAGVAGDGIDGIAVVTALKPDVVVLDIEMPRLDGVQALAGILAAAPGCRVLMSSRLTLPGARIAMLCLQQGAADVIAKPGFQNNLGALHAYRHELIDKIRAVAPAPGENLVSRGRRPASDWAADGSDSRGGQPAKRQVLPKNRQPHVILIGASTGGPQAVGEFLAAASAIVRRVPVVIAQHMPGLFTTVFAEHLVRTTGFVCREAKHGDGLRAGHVYIAPGGHHTLFTGKGADARIVLNEDAPVRFSRPSIDMMMETGAATFGARAWCVLLTGMGQDGLLGAQAITQAGGRVYAQSEMSSVVWGIPGSIVRAGLAYGTGTPGELAAEIGGLIEGSRP